MTFYYKTIKQVSKPTMIRILVKPMSTMFRRSNCTKNFVSVSALWFLMMNPIPTRPRLSLHFSWVPNICGIWHCFPAGSWISTRSITFFGWAMLKMNKWRIFKFKFYTNTKGLREKRAKKALYSRKCYVNCLTFYSLIFPQRFSKNSGSGGSKLALAEARKWLKREPPCRIRLVTAAQS